MTLSEEACDDWVLAAGQTGVDYAESLLDLSPQRQMAFLPTVVGKEKAMKERICRIVKDQCGNPRAGARWAMVVSAVAICTSVTVALAQPRPFAPEPVGPPQAGQPMPPRPLLPPAQRELVIEARRNVLNRMLDNLREQQRRTETALRERGDAQDDNTVILRSELMVIRNHIQAIERQLENVAQPPALRPAPGAGPRGQQPAAVIGQRLPRLQNRITEAEATLKQLEADGQGDSEQARTIRENLRQAREQMQGIRGQLNPMPLDREVGPTQPFQPVPMRLPAEPAPLRPAPGPGRPQIELQNQVQQLQNQMNNMNQQMQQMQRLLEQLVAQRNAGQPPRN